MTANTLNVVCGMVLLSIARFDCSRKDIILRNFIAKSSMSLKGILALWKVNDFQDCWVLYRVIVDRYWHLSSIAKNDEFDEFEEWSFFEQVKVHNRIKSDANFNYEAVGDIYNRTRAEKERIKYLSKNKPTWRRPKAERVAKDLGMDFIYKFGYDMASMHVHPMANDGQEDFHTITGIPSETNFPSQIAVLNNSILKMTIILQDAMNYSSFSWRRSLWDFIDHVRSFLTTGSTEYQISFLKLSEIFPDQTLCEPVRNE